MRHRGTILILNNIIEGNNRCIYNNIKFEGPRRWWRGPDILQLHRSRQDKWVIIIIALSYKLQLDRPKRNKNKTIKQNTNFTYTIIRIGITTISVYRHNINLSAFLFESSTTEIHDIEWSYRVFVLHACSMCPGKNNNYSYFSII